MTVYFETFKRSVFFTTFVTHAIELKVKLSVLALEPAESLTDAAFAVGAEIKSCKT